MPTCRLSWSAVLEVGRHRQWVGRETQHPWVTSVNTASPTTGMESWDTCLRSTSAASNKMTSASILVQHVMTWVLTSLTSTSLLKVSRSSYCFICHEYCVWTKPVTAGVRCWDRGFSDNQWRWSCGGPAVLTPHFLTMGVQMCTDPGLPTF